MDSADKEAFRRDLINIAKTTLSSKGEFGRLIGQCCRLIRTTLQSLLWMRCCD
jgi:hypothetical protein